MSGKEMKKTSDELFILDGKPSLGQTVPLALQHIVAMIVGCVTPAIIVAGVAGFYYPYSGSTCYVSYFNIITVISI